MMRGLLSMLLVVFVANTAHAQVPTIPPLPGGPITPMAPVTPVAALPHVRNGVFDLRFVNVGQVVDLVYGDALHVPHVISSDVLQDTRVVSFQFDSSKGDLRAFVMAFLDSQGFAVTTRDGVDFIAKKPDAARAEDRVTYVYQPRHRSAAYLSSLVLPLFSRTALVPPVLSSVPPAPVASAPFGSSGVPASMPVSPPVAQAPVTTSADQFVFAGTASEVAQVKALLPELDTVAGEVVVRGWAYEVSDTDNSNSGFSIASKLLGVGLQVGEGSTAADSNAFQFGAGRLSFAISALNADSRFHEVSSPNVRCVSGQQVKLNVGQQVPTVSSVSYQGNSGTPVQSIEYQDAGVIFNVTPTVMQDVIQLNVDEEISSFVSTTTGVNGSPTKNTRSLQTVANLRDGEVVVLGGLIQDSDTVSNSRERFLPAFLGGHTTLKGRTEVVLVLQVQKI
ncbi:type II secretion system protein GspD [Paraburkholderia flava]|uniref:type II secretion system protein GspD n=1 Tax=Paraburkholderia flava TaxID=2547393 RepID=UPI001F10C5A6|nr:type II secretory pathway protein [Paraburkholderia flava]